MNIFVTSSDPAACAKALDDKRLVKMVLETAQLLATTHNLCGGVGAGTYKTTHQNHPCAVWVRECSANYAWTYCHFHELCREYTARFGRTHKCEENDGKWLCIPDGVPESNGRRTPFANCTPYMDEPDVHAAYRRTMRNKWWKDSGIARPPRWTNATAPDWATETTA